MTKADSLPCCECSHFQQELILLRNEQASLRATVANLLNQLSMALQANAELRIENQTLRDEIARLKGTSPRPKIPPGGLENSGKGLKGGGGNTGGHGRGKHPRNKKTGLTFHNIHCLKPDTIPEGAVFKGTRKYDVQDLVCQAYNTRFQTDDVGTRHCSKNCYTNVICNEYFVSLTTTDSKNRINFLTILAQGRGEYRFNQDAYDYLAAYKDTEWLVTALNRLLFVLECPTTPLHNNLSETGGRGAKVKSKISGGTRSDEGRQAWDTFGSLNLTCRRLGICFYEYLVDRFLNLNKISNLGTVIRERVKAAKATSPPIFAEALGAILGAA